MRFGRIVALNGAALALTVLVVPTVRWAGRPAGVVLLLVALALVLYAAFCVGLLPRAD